MNKNTLVSGCYECLEVSWCCVYPKFFFSFAWKGGFIKGKKQTTPSEHDKITQRKQTYVEPKEERDPKDNADKQTDDEPKEEHSPSKYYSPKCESWKSQESIEYEPLSTFAGKRRTLKFGNKGPSLSVGYRHLSRLQQTNKLCKRHISPSISNHYLPRCKAPEIMEHFLIHFSYSHSISSHILLLLALELGLLHSQHHGRAVTCHGRRDRSSRKLFLVVLLWSIWREREMTVFESKESDWIEVHDIIKVIVGSWLRLKFNFMSISYFMRDWKACMCDQVRLGRTLLP